MVLLLRPPTVLRGRVPCPTVGRRKEKSIELLLYPCSRTRELGCRECPLALFLEQRSTYAGLRSHGVIKRDLTSGVLGNNVQLAWPSMNETSLSLLQQMPESPEQVAWLRLHELYEPLIRKWLMRYELQPSDADDVTQEVLLAVSKDIGTFDHNGRPGAFRAWMKGILVNRLRKFWHSRDRQPNASGGSDMNRRLAELDDPASQVTLIWNQDHDRHVLAQLMAIVESQVEPKTWEAFQMTAFGGVKPAVAAQKLGLSLNAVVIAKSRVLSRLRHEAKGLVEASSQFS